METRGQTAVHLSPGEGKAFAVLGCDLNTFKVLSEDTEGAFSLVESQTPPQAGPPPHVHRREDEWIYVLEGEYELLDGDRTIRATAGSCTFLPKGRLHTFKNVGDTPGKLLCLYRPGGFERYFGEPGVGEPVEEPSAPISEGPPDMERVMAISERYGLEIPPPPGH